MSSNDSIIFQLTNIGALQREPQFQTPKKSSSSGPLTPPSSKGKWWTPFSERRPSPTRPFPSRTDSLPRPTFNLPPRTPKRSFLNSVCTVCDEPIFTRGSGERIIELECGHISHQECLVVSFDESRGADEILEMFPKCKMCGSDVRCLPKNRDFKDKLISEYLIRSDLYGLVWYQRLQEVRDLMFKSRWLRGVISIQDHARSSLCRRRRYGRLARDRYYLLWLI